MNERDETDATGAVDAADTTLAQLIERARALASRGERVILGITGAPGAGKSTLAERIVAELGDELAVLVPMDGYHLANVVLDDLGYRARKGAPHTFDAFGYLSLMRRIHAQRENAAAGIDGVVYAPQFRRDLEEPVGSAIPVHPETPLVVTEGNYLLLEEEPWPHVRALVDETWFLAPDESQRLAWLIDRHVRFGRSPDEARERSLGSDQRNAEAITATAGRADAVFRLTGV
ncbi:nucleoside/nucleotide kinase family protein [Microbacterium sp.]|uniref:nucleoside/nucleotide kinase family protein n=1 Tax=Microbacterium sp. TaxID=51671 RepID=UPI0032213D8E